VFAVLHIADFALQAVLRTEPGAFARPAALFSDNAKKSIVLVANAAARAATIERGMTAPQAVARCPSLIIRVPNRSAEAEARAALLAVGFTMSPTIEDTAPGVCTIDLKGTTPSMQQRAADAAVTQLAALGFIASAGIAETPLLALYAAREEKAEGLKAEGLKQNTEVEGSELRVESPAGEPPVRRVVPDAPREYPVDRLQKRGEGTPPTPNPANLPLWAGCPHPASEFKLEEPAATPEPTLNCESRTVHFSNVAASASEPTAPPLAGARSHEPTVRPTVNREPGTGNFAAAAASVRIITNPASFLAPLPLTAADPAPEVASILASWGLRTLGDLTALSRDDVGRRLGPTGTALWDRARGGSPRPLNPVTQPQTFSAEMEFEQEIETLEPLLFILRRFLDRLTLELRAACFVAAALELRLTLANETSYERLFRLPEPTADPEILFRALHSHLEALHTDEAIVAVALRVAPTRPLVRQQGLFDTGLRDPHGFAETLARVSAIVGAERVGTPQREDTHRPDAVRLVPPAPVIPPAAPEPVHPPIGPPLRRYRPPLRAQLELTDGRPSYLWTERFNGAVADILGPWLSSGDWWQSDRAWRRTEYDIALADGGLYRLVYADQSWFVEGEYD
jgi:nucleotidyltransferase/DNA polymerase involved in DNA repair